MATYESKAGDIKVEKVIHLTPKVKDDTKTINIIIPEMEDIFSTEGNLTDRGFPSSTEGMSSQNIDNVNYENEFDDGEINIFVSYPTVKTIEIPEGLGTCFTFMGWQKIEDETSEQYFLRENYGMNFDDEGFAKIKDRYVVATTDKYGEVGTCIDVVMQDGQIVKCVIGDIKNQKDKTCNEWGHLDGQCVVEFVVDCNTWYESDWEHGDHVNPGTDDCHPEWETVKEIRKLDMNFLG